MIDRCNLTILSEPGQDDLAEFLAAQGVEVVASLPCYSVANVDRQRGDGVFDRSIAGLKQLNALGYAGEGSALVSKGTFHSYMQLLKGAYQPQNLGTVMCDSMLSVDLHGDLYDCDFNQMLGLRARINGAGRPHQRQLLAHTGVGEAIRVAGHCYGCTAGQGSSCGGALGASPTALEPA